MKTTNYTFLIACAALSVSAMLCGCSSKNIISGDGTVETRDTCIEAFESLTVTSGIDVTFTATEAGAKASAHISAPKSLMPYLVMEVKDGKLTVGLDNSHNYRSTDRINISISAPMASTFAATSGADLEIACAYPADTITLQCTSGADIVVPAITCSAITAQCTSGADIEIKKLSADTATLQCTSGADIDVECTSVFSLDASATSGAGIDISGKVEALICSATSGAVIDASKIDKSTLLKHEISKNSAASVRF